MSRPILPQLESEVAHNIQRDKSQARAGPATGVQSMRRGSTRRDGFARVFAVVAILAALLSKVLVVGTMPASSAELAKSFHGPTAMLAGTNCDKKSEGAPAPICPHQHDHCVLCVSSGSNGDRLAISSWTRLPFLLFRFASTAVLVDSRDISAFALLRGRSLPARASPAA